MDSKARKQAAKKFREYWTFQRGSEKGEDQQFWNSLLADVLGVEDVKRHIQYQVPVVVFNAEAQSRRETQSESKNLCEPQRLSDSALKNRTTKFLDAWIPETRVLIEHKSRGVNLDAPQSGHGGLTPYQQAKEYDNARGFDEKARWIVTCNFDEIRVYDCAAPLEDPQKIRLAELPRDWPRLEFLVNPAVKKVNDRELEISVQAGRIVGKLYDALLKQYGDDFNAEAQRRRGAQRDSSGTGVPPVQEYDKEARSSTLRLCDSALKNETLASLNRLCVRLVFCLYAEDSDVFPKDCFRRLVAMTDAHSLRNTLQRLFTVLDTPPEKRDRYLEPELAVFPYVNGGLFRAHGQDARATSGTGVSSIQNDEIPPLTDEIKELLSGSSDFDWSGISPTIFGAVFESTLNPDTRRKGGMHYTSVANIHKVIDPLFMDELERRFEEILGETARPESSPYHSTPVGAALRAARSPSLCELNKKQRQALLALQDEISKLTFLDPACGSGNFLTETYLSLRRLENRIIAALQRGQSELDLGTTVKVSIHQFHGIEINDFAAEVAKAALWIAEAQMLRETETILHRNFDFLPLKSYSGIFEGNALRMDWGDLISHRDTEAQRDGEPGVLALPAVPATTASHGEPGVLALPPRAGRGSTPGCPPSAKQKQFDYIMGNPPFCGRRYRTPDQIADVAQFFDYKDVDYVACWYYKAAEIAARCNSHVAFVSTNSICQGEQVAAIWQRLMERFGLEIDFAWRTFRWDSESNDKAHVHCVIIGFHCNKETEVKDGI